VLSIQEAEVEGRVKMLCSGGPRGKVVIYNKEDLVLFSSSDNLGEVQSLVEPSNIIYLKELKNKENIIIRVSKDFLFASNM
jgi:hypothetical protein